MYLQTSSYNTAFEISIHSSSHQQKVKKEVSYSTGVHRWNETRALLCRAITRIEVAIRTAADIRSNRNPTQRAVPMKANAQLPLRSISAKKSERNRSWAAYARMVGSPCKAKVVRLERCGRSAVPYCMNVLVLYKLYQPHESGWIL